MSVAADEIRWQLSESSRKRLNDLGYEPMLDYGEVGHALYKHRSTGLIIEVMTNVRRRTEQDDRLMFDPVLSTVR